MTLKEFKKQIEDCKDISEDTELMLHAESGDYAISELQYTKNDKTLRICTMDETRKQVFRISYLITKDHQTFAFNTVRRTLESEDDIILDIEEWEKKLLHEAGIDGEIAERTGSTIVLEKEKQIDIDSVTEKAKWVDKEIKHYYNCQILEIFKEIDDENDIYVRVWKNGSIG